MEVKHIEGNIYEVSRPTFFIWRVRTFEVVRDPNSEYVHFEGYNPFYYKSSGEMVELSLGIKINDKIKAQERLEAWNKG